MAMLAVPSGASAADIDVDIYRPRPVYVAPRVVVAPGVVTTRNGCVTRRARIWVGNHYAYRAVRRCY
jgi:hypothetical protein